MNNQAKKCRVAILMLRHNSFHKLMVNYFLNCIGNGPQDIYEPSIMPFNNINTDDIKNRVRKALLNGYDIFVPIGETCMLAAKEVLDEFGGHPTIFIGVGNPLGNQLAQSFEKPGGYITGATRQMISTDKIVQVVLLLYPTITRILIPYLPTAIGGSLQKQVLEVKDKLEAQGVTVFTVHINNSKDSLFSTLDDYRARVQCILFLEGCSSNIYQAQVAYYCWENKLLCFGSGTYAIDQGVACGFSGDISDVARAAYKALRMYYEKHVSISSIPIEVLPDNQEFCINIDMLRKINFPKNKIEELKKNSRIKVIRKWINPPYPE